MYKRQEIDSIIISHGHDDHTLGLKYYFNQNYNNDILLIAHPDAFYCKMHDGCLLYTSVINVTFLL